MTSSNYPDDIDLLFWEHKALMEKATEALMKQATEAEMELSQMFMRETLVPQVYHGNRADRRRQAAKARKAKP